jgi:hypothetical protein
MSFDLKSDEKSYPRPQSRTICIQETRELSGMISARSQVPDDYWNSYNKNSFHAQSKTDEDENNEAYIANTGRRKKEYKPKDEHKNSSRQLTASQSKQKKENTGKKEAILTRPSSRQATSQSKATEQVQQLPHLSSGFYYGGGAFVSTSSSSSSSTSGLIPNTNEDDVYNYAVNFANIVSHCGRKSLIGSTNAFTLAEGPPFASGGSKKKDTHQKVRKEKYREKSIENIMAQ